MSYISSRRSIFCMTSTTCNIVIAIGLSITPFAMTGRNEWAYHAADNVPVCIFVPTTTAGRILLYIDAIYSYGIVWFVMFSSSIGMLTIACTSAKSRVVPLPQVDNRRRRALIQKKPKQTAWCTDASKSSIPCLNERHSQTALDTGGPSSSRMFVPRTGAKKPQGFIAPVNRKRKHHNKIGGDEENFEPSRKLSIVATNVVFCEELTLFKDGSGQWKSSAHAINTGSKGIPFSVHREITVEQNSDDESKPIRKLAFSSSITPTKGLKRSRTLDRLSSFRNSRRLKFARRKLQQRSSFQLNIKALMNLTLTLFVFSLLTFPVFYMHVTLASSRSNVGIQSDNTLSVIASIAMAAVYFTYPLMIVMADKTMKDTIARLVKKVFHENDLDSDLVQTDPSLDV
ncbi:uncharacterized protein LOC143460647 [Clavelina lepadiformis]|uniref:uncharacterized protein LOC143460647 n=1 Tax=Clavelina lepadiformis TaxID=159417 RepID=UPI0040414FBF